MKYLTVIGIVGVLTLGGFGIATAATAPSAADTTTTSVDPPTVPGAVIHSTGYVLTYTIADPSGATKPTTGSVGTGKYRCNRYRKYLVKQIGVIGSSAVPAGDEITAVSQCTPDPNSFTTDTTVPK